MHSFCAKPSEDNLEWVLSLTDYGNQRYVSMVQKGNVVAAQFHPEKSGSVGLEMIRSFLASQGVLRDDVSRLVDLQSISLFAETKLAKRVIACLDVRSNDDGDLVVTKGDQYDVREAPSTSTRRFESNFDFHVQSNIAALFPCLEEASAISASRWLCANNTTMTAPMR